MKNTAIRSIVPMLLLSLLLLHACTKESGPVSNAPAPTHHAGNPMFGYSSARYAGTDYSQSISIDTANALIGSYLSSVNYPAADTALRSLTFDADTLRAYLQNSNIVTLKFMIAHQPAYKAGNYGVYAGMNPTALTMIIVGQDDDDNYVLNYRGEVYEHMLQCPTYCTGYSSAVIH